MQTVTLGKTGVTVPKNGFGALPIQRISEQDACALLRRAYDAGIVFFDTARAYSDSERKIGLALADVRPQIFLATKTASKDADGFWRDLHESLRNLRTDYVDLYQFHNPASVPTPGDGSGLYEAMLEAKAQGLVRHIGITNHRLRTAEEAVRSGLYETLQFPFCHLASEPDLALVRLCAEKQVGFIAMKGLSGGLLTNAKAAFAWLAQFENVLPIWGVQRLRELEEFISYGESPPALTDELLAAVEKDRRELQGDFCRACGYCMPCPQGIQISTCARMSQLIRRSPSAGWLTPESQAMMQKVDDCIRCGHCTSKCPYGLDTPALLRRNFEDYQRILAGKATV